MKQNKLREAKRKNRLRRLNNWKTGNTKAAKLRKEIRKAARRYAFILNYKDALEVAVREVGAAARKLGESLQRAFSKGFADCVPYIPGIYYKCKEAEYGS